MGEYRRELTLDPDREYHYVDMGPYNALNGPASYPFPTEKAAIRFASSHKRTAAQAGIDRLISVRFPDGRQLDIELTQPLGDLDDEPPASHP